MITKKIVPPLLVVMAIFPFLYILVPLFHLFTSVSWSDFLTTLGDPEVMSAIKTSIYASVITTIGALVFGLPTAFVLSLRDFRGKRFIESLFLLPLVMPPLIGGIGQLFLYGPNTAIGGWFDQHGIALTGSLIGVVLAQSYITSPFLILSAKAGFEEIPKELKDVTRELGGGVWHLFWYVSIPLAREAILTGTILTFARAIGEFGATMIMAYHPYTLPIEIWVQFTSGGLEAILPIAVFVTLFAILIAILASIRKPYKY